MGLLEVLWLQNTCYIYDQILKSGVLNCLLDLFFTYKWNNFLHDLVQNIVLAGLQLQYADFVYPHLFGECHIAERILAAEEENKVYSASDRGNKSNLGYIGHVTRMSWLLDSKKHTLSDRDFKCQEEDDVGCGSYAFIKDDGLLLKWKDYIKNTVSTRLETQSAFLGSESSGHSAPNALDDNSMSAYGSFEPSDFYSRVTNEIESEEIYDNFGGINVNRLNDDDDDDDDITGVRNINNNDDDDPIDNLFYELNSMRFSHLKINYNFDTEYNESDENEDEDEDGNEKENGNDEESNDDFYDNDDDDEDFFDDYSSEDASDAMIHRGVINFAHSHNGNLYINDDGEYAFFDE